MTSKWGIEVKAETEITVSMSGLEGTVKLVPDKTFEAQLGVDWVKRTLHILEGECSSPGEEVYQTSVTWHDGERTKTAEIEVPEHGCYCFYADNSDLEIDDASIRFDGYDEFTIDFYS